MLKVYLFVVGLIFISIGIAASVSRYRSLRAHRRVEGKVADWLETPDPDDPESRLYYKRIAFQGADGAERTFVSRVGRSSPRPPAPAACIVSFDPANPNDAVEAEWIPMWGWQAAMVLLGAVALFASYAQ